MGLELDRPTATRWLRQHANVEDAMSAALAGDGAGAEATKAAETAAGIDDCHWYRTTGSEATKPRARSAPTKTKDEPRGTKRSICELCGIEVDDPAMETEITSRNLSEKRPIKRRSVSYM